MVDHTDNNQGSNEQDDESAAILYRRYRLNNAEHGNGVTSSQLSNKDKQDTADSLANNVYSQYRQSRRSRTDASVDALLKTINHEHDTQLATQHSASGALKDQPGLADSSPEIQSMNVQPGTVLGEPDSLTQAANDSSLWKRIAVGSAAAVVLGVLLIPQMFNDNVGSGTLQATLPDALSDQAAQVVTYIDATDNSSLGFSNSTDVQRAAFKHGVYSVDLKLAMEAGEKKSVFSVLRQITSIASDQDGADTQSNSIIAAAVKMNESMAADANEDVVSNQLDELLSEVQTASLDAKQLDWYQVGRSVESIRLAAEYALETSDLNPLEQALLLGSQLDAPVQQAPASKSIKTLFDTNIVAPNEFVQADQIRSIANDIKLLMQ